MTPAAAAVTAPQPQTWRPPFQSADAVIARSMRTWKPPPRLSLSQWADEKFRLSSESAAEPGRWKTLPYQKGIMDAITDPSVEEVSLMKSARIGYTSMISAGMGYHIEHDPCSQLVVQPTVDDGKEFSKETIAPMLRDVPALAAIRVRDFEEKGSRDASNTLTHKAFPGGILSITGANSGTGFRRKTRRVVWFDEVDVYPPSAGSEGDPIKLGKKRAETFWNRKIVAGSTPLVAGASRIEEMFQAGDQRRYYVPCPHCGHMDFLTFRRGTGDDARGHWMGFDASSPEAAFASAHFNCRACGCEIGHEHKKQMIERGEWRAEKPFHGHASFHIWSAYSYSPGASWGHIAKEFVEASRGGPEQLQTFINTTIGETWVEKGEAPEWERLYQRRERLEIRRVPRGAIAVTCGIDVQMDRLVYEIVAWADDFQTWGLEADVIMGDTAKEETWAKATELIGRQFLGADGLQYPIHMTAVDSGYNTQAVYNWARQHAAQVIACKGSAAARTMLSQPTAVDVTWNGKRITNGCKVWIVGANIVKGEFYGWLRQDPPTKESGKPYPRGFCHFPESDLYDEEYFKQITAEQIVRTVHRRTRRTTIEWTVLPGRENHYLDCRGLNRVAAYHAGLDQVAAERAQAAPQQSEAPPSSPAAAETGGVAPAAPQAAEGVTPGNSWFHGGRRRT